MKNITTILGIEFVMSSGLGVTICNKLIDLDVCTLKCYANYPAKKRHQRHEFSQGDAKKDGPFGTQDGLQGLEYGLRHQQLGSRAEVMVGGGNQAFFCATLQ